MKINFRSVLLSASLLSPSALLALPVDLSAPAGGIGPTSEQGAALQWLEMTDINFGGGFTLPLRMSFLTTRKEEGQDFGEGYWRTPLHDSRLLTQSPDQKTLMLPCGKIMALEPKPNSPGIWQTPDGEWISRPKGPFTVVSREDGWELEYNAKGYLIRLQNDARRNVLWTRDATGRVLSLAELTDGKSQPPAYTVSRDPKSGRVTTLSVATLHGVKNWQFNYHPSQQLKNINFPDTTTVACDYPTRQDGQPQIAITGRDAVTTLLTWDKTSHHLLSDGVWSYTITPQAGTNPVMTRVGPGGETEVHHEDKATHRTLFTAADGTVTTRSKITTGAARGKLARVERQPAGAEKAVTVYQAEYDERGLLVAEIDALGRKTTHSYTLHGASIHSGIKLRSSTDALGHVTSAEFDAKGNAIATTDALGHTTRNEYDEKNRLIKILGPDGALVRAHTYDAAGKIASRTDAAGAVTSFTYDKNGNLTSTKDALGNESRDLYDQRGLRIQRTDALGQIWKYEHDKGGRLTRTIAPDDQTTERRKYDDKGRLIEVADASDHTKRTEYDVFGRVTSRTDALGRTTRYRYDSGKGASGCQACDASSTATLITLPSGRTLQRRYNADKKIIEESNLSSGPAVENVERTLNEYDLIGNLISTTDPLGRTTRHEYDAANQRIKTTQPDATTKLMSYDSAGHLITQTNEEGQTTKLEYDAYGNMVAMTDSAGNKTTRRYSGPGAAALHRLGEQISPEGRITRYVYDALGRRTHQISGELAEKHTLPPQTTPPSVSTREHRYDALGNEILSIDPEGRQLSHSYDSRNRRISTKDGLGREWKYAYDADTGATGNPPCCGADPVGNAQALTTTFPDGSNESRLTNAAGQLIETQDAKGDRIKYEYDPDGRLSTLVDARGSTTRWTYDSRGKLESKVYPDRSTEAYEHDAAGQLITKTRPDGTAAVHAYDSRSRLLSTVWKRTHETPTQAQLPTPSSYVYDKAGRLTKATNPNAEITRSYTANGRIATETQDITASFDQGAGQKAAGDAAEYRVSYTYTPDGQIDSMTYPDGTAILYTYTARNQLATVSETQEGAAAAAAPNPLASYAYTLDHKVSSIAFSNGTKTVKTYDIVGRLDKVLHMNPGDTALWSETSRYDQRDRRTARIHHDGKADLFSYDPAGQVTAAAYGQSALILPQDPKADTVQPPAVTRWDQTFAYDPAGNRSQFTEAPVGSAEPDAIRQWNYQANAANQYTTVKESNATEPSTTQPRYDPNGNLLTDDRNTYTWDADIHLLSVTTKPSEVRAPGSGQLETLNQKPVTSEFRYDPLHRRVARLEPDGTLTHFIHDGWNVIAEYATPPNHKSQIVNHKLPSARHTWGHDISGKPQGAGGIGGLLASTHFISSTENEERRTKNLTFFLNYDSNGNVVLLTDSKGQESARYAYDAFGKALLATGAMAQHNRYRFSTKPVEIAGVLYFYGYRYYAPELGRWTARDPVSERGGINLHVAMLNNAVNRSDKLGLNPCPPGSGEPTYGGFSTPGECYDNCMETMLDPIITEPVIAATCGVGVGLLTKLLGNNPSSFPLLGYPIGAAIGCAICYTPDWTCEEWLEAD